MQLANILWESLPTINVDFDRMPEQIQQPYIKAAEKLAETVLPTEQELFENAAKLSAREMAEWIVSIRRHYLG